MPIYFVLNQRWWILVSGPTTQRGISRLIFGHIGVQETAGLYLGRHAENVEQASVAERKPVAAPGAVK